MSSFQQESPDVPDSVLERIQKMLALAHNNRSEAEAANALAMAQALLQKYNLEISAVSSHRRVDDLGEVEDKPFAFQSKSTSKYGPNRTRTDQAWVKMVARSVAKGSFCRVIIHRYEILFIGRARNIEASMYMFASITGQIESLALAAVREFNARVRAERERDGWGDRPVYEGNRGGQNYTVFRNSWLLGAASTVQSRLDQQRAEFDRMQQASRPTNGSAPIIYTGMEVALAADDEVGEYMQAKWGWGGKPRPSTAVYVDRRTPEQKAADEAANR